MFLIIEIVRLVNFYEVYNALLPIIVTIVGFFLVCYLLLCFHGYLHCHNHRNDRLRNKPEQNCEFKVSVNPIFFWNII